MADRDKLGRLLDRTVLLDPKGSLPLYAQLTRGLRHLLQEHFEDGERFYGEEMLSQRLRVSVSTTRRALTELAAEGLLVRYVPRGTFVRKRQLGANRDFTVGVFLSSFESRFNMALLERMALCCEEEGYRLDVFHTCFGEKLVEQSPPFNRPPGQQGFVFLTTFEASTWSLYQVLMDRGYRAVVVDRRIEGFPGIYVGVDNTAAMRLGMDHLTSLGHRRIALLVSEEEAHPNVQERIHAFKAYASDYGLEHTRVVVCDQTFNYPEGLPLAERYEMDVNDATVDELLAARPTAIFAVSDAGARVLLRRLAERGVAVPGACSVLGFGNEGYAAVTYPPLSTVAQPFAQMAGQAIKLLASQGPTPAVHLLRPSLVLRKSTAPPILS